MAERGRPSTYTEATAQYICQGLMSGRSLRSICKEQEMPDTTTVFRWLDTIPDFYRQYARARQIQAETMADEIQDIADDSANDFMEIQRKNGVVTVVDMENINRSRLRVDARKWIAAKLLPQKYGDFQKVEHSGGMQVSHTDQELNERIKQLERDLGLASAINDAGRAASPETGATAEEVSAQDESVLPG